MALYFSTYRLTVCTYVKFENFKATKNVEVSIFDIHFIM